MKLILPKIYPITDRRLSGLSHAEQAARLIDGGARFIQIREKRSPSDEFFAAVVECVDVAEGTDTKIIVNDRVDIAMAARAHGVHLGQTDLPPREARNLLGDDAIIGISTHDLEQVESGVAEPVDYIAFGPVWPTRTKENPDPVVGLEMIREVKQLARDIPIVAIGGIKTSNVIETLRAGADSAAIISELYTGPASIEDRYKELVSLASV